MHWIKKKKFFEVEKKKSVQTDWIDTNIISSYYFDIELYKNNLLRNINFATDILRTSLLPILQLLHSSNTVTKNKRFTLNLELKNRISTSRQPQIRSKVVDAPLRGFSLTSFRSLVYPRPCEDLLPYLRFAWPLSLGNKVNQPVFRYDPSHTHTHTRIYIPQQYIYRTHVTRIHVHGYLYTRPRSRVLLHWFRWCERGIGQTMNTKGHGCMEPGRKRALVERRAEKRKTFVFAR